MKRVCVSETELRSTDCKNQVVTHCSTPPAALRWPLTESSLTCWNSSQHLSHVILTKVSSEVRIADAERVKNFRRAVTTSVQEAKPLGDDITKEQWGTLKNPKQDQSMVVHMADSSTAVVLLDTDPYHAMKTLTH